MNIKKKVDWKKIEASLRFQIQVLHEELGWFGKEELRNTPGRIMRFYKEWVEESGDFDLKKFTMFDPVYKGSVKSLIVLRDMDFYSICAHHMLPFFGHAHVAYLPRRKGKYCGASKLGRAIAKFASKPQTQEVLSHEVADFLWKGLDPDFLIVVMEAQHLCMTLRGAKQKEGKLVTSALRYRRGINLSPIKDEALRLMGL